MRLIVFALLAFIITSCSSTPVDPYHEVEFSAIVKEFEDTCGVKVKSSILFVEELNGSAVGVCYMGLYVVFIDKDYWMFRSSKEERFNLIMHELGHCDLFRPHNTKQIVMEINGTNQVVPESIMYPYVFPIPDYPGVKEYYMNELCNGN